MSLEDSIRMRKRQNNKCANCKKDFGDHPYTNRDPETKKIKNLLCFNCYFAFKKRMKQYNIKKEVIKNGK